MKRYTIPLLLIISLFLLWGVAHSILDVLNKHFQDVLVISKARSGLVQAVVYGGYFLMALPAGWFINRFGYQKGIVLGLSLYAFGALLFIPADYIMTFWFFLLALFIIGSGLTFLETAANPYVTELGEPETAASRLNLAQSFNGLGWIIGPMIGGLLVFNADGSSGSAAVPYAIIGLVVLFVAGVFVKVKLPVIVEDYTDLDGLHQGNYTDLDGLRGGSLWHNRGFVFGVVALFFYVAAQTGINSFFINYITESDTSWTSRDASLLLSFGGMGLFMLGRFIGSALMRKISPATILLISVSSAIISVIIVITGIQGLSTSALVATYFFESIMFPTIFALSIQGLGSQTKKASSYLIMAIVGGAISPPLMGYIGETNMAIGFIVPLVCFIIILSYSIYLKRTSA
jgi:MFS transporter, FHS family, L-fucose permease